MPAEALEPYLSGENAPLLAPGVEYHPPIVRQSVAPSMFGAQTLRVDLVTVLMYGMMTSQVLLSNTGTKSKISRLQIALVHRFKYYLLTLQKMMQHMLMTSFK